MSEALFALYQYICPNLKQEHQVYIVNGRAEIQNQVAMIAHAMSFIYTRRSANMDHRANIAHHLCLHMKFCCNTAIPICLCVIYGCFHSITVELINYRKSLLIPDIYYAAFYTKQRLISLEIPWYLNIQGKLNTQKIPLRRKKVFLKKGNLLKL